MSSQQPTDFAKRTTQAVTLLCSQSVDSITRQVFNSASDVRACNSESGGQFTVDATECGKKQLVIPCDLLWLTLVVALLST